MLLCIKTTLENFFKAINQVPDLLLWDLTCKKKKMKIKKLITKTLSSNIGKKCQRFCYVFKYVRVPRYRFF